MSHSAHQSNTARSQPPEPISAAALFKGTREVVIEYRGVLYRLRITRNDKLILTK